MPRITLSVSEKHLMHLEALKQELGLASRSKVLEMIVDQLFEEKDALKFKQEE